MRQKITEEMNVHEQWYDEANKQNLSTLPNFLDSLINSYEHDYGTICHAIAAGMIATGACINRSEQGGITGFQAGCIMWEFVRRWLQLKGPLKLIQYDDMLYPQYESKFQKVISRENADYLINEAKKLIKEEGKVHPRVKQHWEKIANGEIPFTYVVEEENF